MYTNQNFKSKKELYTALAAGKAVYCYQPGGIFLAPWEKADQPKGTYNKVSLEGPHFPQPHKWYATGTCDHEGRLIDVDGLAAFKRKLEREKAKNNAT